MFLCSSVVMYVKLHKHGGVNLYTGLTFTQVCMVMIPYMSQYYPHFGDDLL